jgi:hypothetical protein
MPTEPGHPDVVRASVIDRFRRLAIAPGQERKFPVGPESAKTGFRQYAVASPAPV